MLTLLTCVADWMRNSTYSFPGYEVRMHGDSCDFRKRNTGELIISATIDDKALTDTGYASLVRFWVLQDYYRDLAASLVLPNNSADAVKFHRWQRKSKISADIRNEMRKTIDEQQIVLNAGDPNFFNSLRSQIITLLKDTEREFDGMDTFGEAELQ